MGKKDEKGEKKRVAKEVKEEVENIEKEVRSEYVDDDQVRK